MLSDLARWREALNMAWIARQIGTSRQALYNRLERGAPELTENESARLIKAFNRIGLQLWP